MQDVFDKQAQGCLHRVGVADADADVLNSDSHLQSKRSAWTTCIPRVAPLRKSSYPFCPVTPNPTGWKECAEQRNGRGAVRVQPTLVKQYRYQYIIDLKPKGAKHMVSGADDAVPSMPNQDKACPGLEDIDVNMETAPKTSRNCATPLC